MNLKQRRSAAQPQATGPDRSPVAADEPQQTIGSTAISAIERLPRDATNDIRELGMIWSPPLASPATNIALAGEPVKQC